MLAVQAGRRRLVELQHDLVPAADDQQRRRAHGSQPCAGQVGSAAPGDDRGDVGVGSAAAHRAAPAPVLAPKNPMGSRAALRLLAQPRGHPRQPTGQQLDVEDRGPVGLLGRREQVEQQGRQPARCSTSATYRLRGLCRLLPLPCTKTTRPSGCSGTVRWPARRAGPARPPRPPRPGPEGRQPPTPAGARPPEPVPTDRAGELHDLLVPDGPEVGIRLTHGREVRGRLQDDQFVHLPAQLPATRGEQIGAASTTRCAPCARATAQAARAVAPVAIPSSTSTAVRPSSDARGRSPRKRSARRSSSARSRSSTAASSAGAIPANATTSELTTSTPPSPTAPIASSGWKGRRSFRTTITSRGAARLRATSNATGTPPRGRPSTTTSWPHRCPIRSANRRPASVRSAKDGALLGHMRAIVATRPGGRPVSSVLHGRTFGLLGPGGGTEGPRSAFAATLGPVGCPGPVGPMSGDRGRRLPCHPGWADEPGTRSVHFRRTS